MRFSGLVLCLAAWLSCQSAAVAQTPACVAPGPPPADSARPLKIGGEPAAPRCVNLQTHIAHCSKGELERYNDAINTYNAHVTDWNKSAADYVDAMNAWTRAAGNYGLCEIGLMNKDMPHG